MALRNPVTFSRKHYNCLLGEPKVKVSDIEALLILDEKTEGFYLPFEERATYLAQLYSEFLVSPYNEAQYPLIDCIERFLSSRATN